MTDIDRDDSRRPDPDALLALAEKDHRGKLTVFLGAALGLGTILMAQARQEAEAKKVEVPDGAPVN